MKKAVSLAACLALLFIFVGATPDKLVDPIELGATVGGQDGVGYERWAFITGATLNAGTDTFRIRGNVSWVNVHKGMTPGGYSIGGGGGLEVDIWKLHAFGGMSFHFTDQQVWTKRVRYANAGLGYRWSNRHDANGRPTEISNVELSVSREIFSTYPNNVTGVQASCRYDRRIGRGPFYGRGSISVGGMWFESDPYPNARKMQGSSLTIGVGLVWRGWH